MITSAEVEQQRSTWIGDTTSVNLQASSLELELTVVIVSNFLKFPPSTRACSAIYASQYHQIEVLRKKMLEEVAYIYRTVHRYHKPGERYLQAFPMINLYRTRRYQADSQQ